MLVVHCFASVHAWAAAPAYPTKAIEIIVPFSPGGAVDSVSRIIADRLQVKWDKPVSVVKKPGGNTVPAIDLIMRARQAGYEILADTHTARSMREAVGKGLHLKAD